MQRKYPIFRPALAGCVLLALAACNDDQNPEPGLAPSETPSLAAGAPAYDIVKVPSITVDGNLSEWANVAAISMADASGRTGGVDNTAKVKLAWDDTYLYAAYDVTDTELLAIQTTRDHANIFQDDEVELYIDPQGDGATATSMTATDYQFLANVLDAIGDKNGDGVGGKSASYNAASFLSKAVTNGTLNATGNDVGYTVELRVSWSDLGVTPAAGNTMRIDPVVGDRDGAGPPPVQSFDWAGLTGNYNNPASWKEVRLVNPPPVSAYDVLQVGASAITVDGNLSEWSGVPAISIADTSGRTGGVDNTARIKLAWNDTYLYAAYDVSDTELLAIQTTRDASNLFQDDAVELYVDPQGDGGGAQFMSTSDYQLLASVREVIGDKNGDGVGGKSASYNAASFLAKAVANGTLNAAGTDAGYTVELRISWTDLGVTPSAGSFLRINPAVDDRDGAGPPPNQSFAWGGIPGDYDNPVDWKDIQLVSQAPPPPPPPVATFRFPVGMAKDQDSDLGTDAFSYNPDGKRSAIGKSMLPTLRYARQHGARVIMTVTGADNQNLRTDPSTKSAFAKDIWLSRFNSAASAISPDTVRDYVKDGTLIGIYVIDEPWSDFTSFTYQTLDSLCQHVKGEWPWAPCLARTDNQVINSNTPQNYIYKYLDAGWAQVTDFKERNSTAGTIRSYYEDELAFGKAHGLGLWYGFNLIHYVSKTFDPNCSPQLDGVAKCAMTAAQVRAVGDAIAAIDANGGINGIKGCGVSGWYLDKNAGDARRNYFLSTGITSALQYLWDHTAGQNLQPGPCNIRGDLPAP